MINRYNPMPTYNSGYNRLKRKRTSYKKYNKKYNKKRASKYVSKKNLKLVKIVKSIMLKNSELKRVYVNPGTLNLLHNGWFGTVPILNGVLLGLTGGSYMPTQGTGENMRIGDEINLSGWKVSCVFNQMADRPNVTFRVIVMQVPWNATPVYSQWFKAISGNVLLDDPNPDFIKHKMLDVFIRPNQASLVASGGRSYTFCKKYWIPLKRRIKFGPADATTAQTNVDDVWFTVMAYDAQGTLATDKIAEVSCYVETCYRDP